MALLRVKDSQELTQIAERLRQSIGSAPFLMPGGPRKMTMSIGCTLLTQGEQIDDAIKRADGGLYAAKHGGRDQVVYVPALS